MNLKDEYNKTFVEDLADKFSSEVSFFNKSSFVKTIINNAWKNKELKERVRCISENMNSHINLSYPEQIKIISKVAPKYTGLKAFVFPNFIEQYGLNFPDISFKTMEQFTQLSTAEFAIRPFIEKYPKETMKQMLDWSTHENFHIRRLASEGLRPRLPWASPLRDFIKDPSPTLPILDNLKNDPSEYVRKSVANHLNDISKDHPKLILQVAKKWYGKNKNTNWIVKHALRTLLKKGNKEALAIFGFDNSKGIKIDGITLSNSSISIGEYIHFEFSTINEIPEDRNIRLEYRIDYVKANGSLSGKIFQLSEFSLKANSKKRFKRKQWFKDLSTRKHYPGKHKITLIVNGDEKSSTKLLLKN